MIEESDPFAAERLPINVALSGEQDARGLMFTLQAVSKHLRLDATGRTLIPSGRTDAKLDARLDARAPRSNSHALAFDASTDVLWSPTDATLRLSDGALTGTLDGRPVSLEGHAALSLASNVRANALDVTGALGSNRLRIQKEAGTAPEAALRIDLADLTEIHPDMRGEAAQREGSEVRWPHRIWVFSACLTAPVCARCPSPSSALRFIWHRG